MRPTVAVLSKQNLLDNLRLIRQKAAKAKIVAMVKANAYGHGLQSTGLILDKAVDLLGVACIDEALALRAAGVNSPVLLAQGIFEENELFLAAEHNFPIAFHNTSQVDGLIDLLETHVFWFLGRKK